MSRESAIAVMMDRAEADRMQAAVFVMEVETRLQDSRFANDAHIMQAVLRFYPARNQEWTEKLAVIGSVISHLREGGG